MPRLAQQLQTQRAQPPRMTPRQAAGGDVAGLQLTKIGSSGASGGV